MENIPHLCSVKDTERHIGLGHTKVYQLIADGVLDARKSGAKTLITGESIRAFIAGLPQAGIGARRRAVDVRPHNFD